MLIYVNNEDFKFYGSCNDYDKFYENLKNKKKVKLSLIDKENK